MRTYILSVGWALAIVLVAIGSRAGWVDKRSAEFLLMVLPMIAFVTLLGRRNCRSAIRGA